MLLVQSVFYFIASSLLLGIAVSGDNCTDGNLSIIGGHKVSVEDAPFIAALYYSTNDSAYKPFCGGSVIHERFVLTAAHCPFFINLFYGNVSLRVLVGTDHLDTGGMFIDVDQEFCYESFGGYDVENDICLLKLKEPVPLNCKVAKLKLPDEDFEVEVGTLVNVTGFGDVGHNDGMENELRQTMIPVVSDECCHELYDVNVTQLCAGSRGHDSCQGDSGGPLTYNGIQVGVVSYGEYCLNSQAGVYTRVSSYVEWINNIIKENE